VSTPKIDPLYGREDRASKWQDCGSRRGPRHADGRDQRDLYPQRSTPEDLLMLDKAYHERRKITLDQAVKVLSWTVIAACVLVLLLHIGLRGGSPSPVKTDVPAPVKHSLSKWV